MPATAIFLTIEEYTGIIDRLTALEAAVATRAAALTTLDQRVQGAESTLSAHSATLAALPKLSERITVLEKGTITAVTK